MTLAYLASPYSHEKRSVMENRKFAAVRVAGRLIAAGQHVFCPIAHNGAVIDAVALETGWGVWSSFDKDMLSRCDELVVLKLPGWELSEGVEREVEEALRLGIPVRCLDPNDVPAWPGPSLLERLSALPPMSPEAAALLTDVLDQ